LREATLNCNDELLFLPLYFQLFIAITLFFYFGIVITNPLMISILTNICNLHCA